MKYFLSVVLCALPVMTNPCSSEHPQVYHKPLISYNQNTQTIATSTMASVKRDPIIGVDIDPPGRWVTVIATAYSPNDKIDALHRHCQDNYTADMTRLTDRPYGIAIPMARGADGRSNVPIIAKYGQSIYIPHGHGYLDKSVPSKEDRIFIADDTGGKINAMTRSTGIPHIDLRFRNEASAKKFGKKKIEVFIYDE